MKAIILAAGKGTRLLPMTLVKPKPLLEINGKTLFENMIDFLHLSNINDITVVTGYKHELFDIYQKKLNFKKVINENYGSTNSSSSLKLVLDDIDDDTLIINGDLYIKNNFIKYIKRDVSQFIGQYLNETVNTTWIYHIDNNNRLIDIDTNAKGGGLCETCIAYFSKNDIEFFKKEFEKNDDNEHWDNCIIRILKEKDFYVTEVFDSIYEIDSFSDAFSHNLIDYDEVAKQCSDDNNALRLSAFSHYNYKIKFLGENKIIRIPVICTGSFVDRESEKKVTSILPSTICPKTDFFDLYIKIADYLDGYHNITDEDLNTDFLKYFVKVLKELHSIKLEDNRDFKAMSIHSEINKFESLANIKIVTDSQREFILSIADEIEQDEQVLCHRYLLHSNIMYNGKDVKLIDFEYSGFSSKYLDFASFICMSNMNEEQRLEFINLYDGVDEKRVRKAQLLINYLYTYFNIVNNLKDYEELYRKKLELNLSILNIK